jgi:hypothetical protein
MLAVMQAVFVELLAFERSRESYLDDGGFGRLQEALMANPEAGEVIPATAACVRCDSATRAAPRASAAVCG